MAPNNALADNKSQKTTMTPKQGRTTVLEQGTVEARGMGTLIGSRQVISQEIQDFLDGEAKSVTAEIRAFFTVWTFITRLPGPTWVDHHPGYLMRGMAYFPAAGALVGIFVGVFYDLSHATLQLPAAVAAALSMASSFWVTGCFHEDGLADASDGIGGGWSRSQILKIMTDTRLGTYGCAVLLLYVVTKLHLLAALGESTWALLPQHGSSQGAAPALLVSHTVARLNSSYLIRTRDYVDEGGPKYKFYSFMLQAKYLVTWHRVAFATLTSLFISWLVYDVPVAVALVTAALLTGHMAGMYGEYILGGVMGDYLGATICVTELVVLTLIFLQDSIRDASTRLQEFVLTGKLPEDFPDWIALQEDEGVAALGRFLVVVTFTLLWCATVGHPSVLVRDIAIRNAEKDDGEIRIGLAKATNKDKPELQINQLTKEAFLEHYNKSRHYIDTLAKPQGSLGGLEDWAARISALQGLSASAQANPSVENVQCIIFAADHGMAASPDKGGEGCSAFPQAVTRSILEGLERGVAGASVFCKVNNVPLRVIDVGVCGEPIGDGSGVVTTSEHKLSHGTCNACTKSAMTLEQTKAMIQEGRMAVQQAVMAGAKLIALGEVGIGNTTASSCLLAALCDCDVAAVCDGGATVGRTVDPAVVKKKIYIVQKALKQHKLNSTKSFMPPSLTSRTGSDKATSSDKAMHALTKVGGAELAALVGAMMEACQVNIPVIVDGFIVTVAAMVACQLDPRISGVLLFATQSAEKGYQVAIQTIEAIANSQGLPFSPPALSMGLRMGEATGALLAVPLARSACAMVSDMATIMEILNPAPAEDEDPRNKC